jgi:hypothetical protein
MSNVPPMPPSSHGWWKNAKVEKIEIRPPVRCSHQFELVEGGAKCVKCNLGFSGEGFEIRDGILHNRKMSAH